MGKGTWSEFAEEEMHLNQSWSCDLCNYDENDLLYDSCKACGFVNEDSLTLTKEDL